MNFMRYIMLVVIGGFCSLNAMTDVKDPASFEKKKALGMLRTIAREYERVVHAAVQKYSKPDIMAEYGLKTPKDIAYVVHVRAEDAPGEFDDAMDEIIEKLPDDSFRTTLKQVYGDLKHMVSYDKDGKSRNNTFNTPDEVVALVQEVAQGLNALADTLATIV